MHARTRVVRLQVLAGPEYARGKYVKLMEPAGEPRGVLRVGVVV